MQTEHSLGSSGSGEDRPPVTALHLAKTCTDDPTHLTCSCWTKETQLSIDLSGGCWLCIGYTLILDHAEIELGVPGVNTLSAAHLDWLTVGYAVWVVRSTVKPR